MTTSTDGAALPTLAGASSLVTGAAGGVGREVVALLRAAGARVVAEDLDPAVEILAAEDPEVLAVVGDAADADVARRAVALAAEAGGGSLDVLVTCAARFLTKPTVDTTDEEWDDLMRTNVRGTFVHLRAALGVLRAGGAVVTVASISGVVGLPAQAAYSATKGAIVQLTRSLAVELGPRARVNCVAPGAIDTAFLRDALPPDPEEVLAAIAADHPSGRISTPREVAQVVAFLASPAASAMTGAIVMADGGYSAA